MVAACASAACPICFEQPCEVVPLCCPETGRAETEVLTRMNTVKTTIADHRCLPQFTNEIGVDSGYIHDVHNVSPMQSPKKTLVRGFRLDADILRMLQIAARRNRTSENSFVESLLLRRLKIDPLIPVFDYIGLGRDAINQLSESLLQLQLRCTEHGHNLAVTICQSNQSSAGAAY